MKYRAQYKGKAKRGSKNNLTKGCFGICDIGEITSMKVVRKSERTAIHNKYGVEGKLNSFRGFPTPPPAVPATNKGKIPSNYIPFKSNNKYIYIGQGKVKKNG